ncbi:double-strand break repair protein AddB [Tabrizicola sp. YIM 78059]|uniref:double-strand break repair protein AddB n=1 Tax=Tabrizicola sp. YIM 78059 TaxID=2529861 RepID=UPI0020C14513|nr:double-strand break repair protein AddB [Tabrizicola sp. YIM 78059]
MTEPALYALPPGVDFPAELVAGILARHAGQPPETLARLTLILNTARMRRRVADCFAATGARLLPRLLLVTEVPEALAREPLAPVVPPLRRRLHFARLLEGLLQTGSTHFPRAGLYDLADSLARLMAEMQEEAVSRDRIAALDVGNHSAHWARMQVFLGIVAEAMSGEGMDAEARQRRAVEALAEGWQVSPPGHPVMLAGSTGSRGTTALLMQAIARLPGGAVVLPGFDFDLPDAVWHGMDDALTAEDHPQYRFRRLMEALGIAPRDVRPWTTAQAPAPDRNRLISLSLRPAPVTDQWLTEGQALPDLIPATRDMTLIEAPSERAEALAIALVLRQAAEAGTTAALVCPDRNLTRRVTAALDRWGLRPDDSAGRPLALSAPGRLLRQVAGLFGQRLTIDAALAILKHPLVFSGPGRGGHLILTREYELHARRNGPAFPTAESLAAWAAASGIGRAVEWAAILGETLCGHEDTGTTPLPELVARHLSVTERLARGFGESGSGALWEKEAGEAARSAMADLAAEAGAGGAVTPGDYANLLRTVLSGEVREAETVNPSIMIRGTLEARVQGADLVVLGGLNDGVWPAQAAPDPWLNRAMRKAAGLLLPERQIGLAAHDYQQAIAAPRVVLSRSLRGAEAETVPSRWLNRLVNLMEGLPDRQGPQALKAMRQRGHDWLALAAAFDRPPALAEPAPRPSPRPPVEARPKRLSLTEIGTLVRDPYAIYARHVLRLRPLDPLRPEPDPRLRGIVLHEILEKFVREGGRDRETLLRIAAHTLEAHVAWPLARSVWLARIDRAADAFLRFSANTGGTPVLTEQKGAVTIEDLDFTLTGKPDRIDRLPDGRLHLIDYKTGTPPTEKQQKAYDKQLLLAAAMAERGGFPGLDPAEVARLTYVGVKGDLKEVVTVPGPGEIDRVWEEFRTLVSRYARQGTGYTARRAPHSTSYTSDYDHLSRFGEWDMTAIPRGEDLA